MKKNILLPFLVPILFLFSACPYGYKYNEGKFPYDPVNIEWANSAYDDYNMSAPTIEGWRYLYFSSNRNSQGHDFDIIGSHFHILWDKNKGTLQVDDQPASWMDLSYVDSLFALINTPSNEYGPYTLSWSVNDGTEAYYTDLMAYSSDAGGNLDLKLVTFNNNGTYPSVENGNFLGPKPISILNSANNDAYLSFYGQNFILSDWGEDPSYIREAYFCSDRSGNYDIYMTPVPADSSLVGFLLSDAAVQISPVDILNSSYQDKCPYVNGQLLVFASDRPGGYGGFDLYYSRRKDNGWTEPVNFGSRINTEYNEYRPVLIMQSAFQNDLMLFSSDRPGGKGGYDLYYVGIAAMID